MKTYSIPLLCLIIISISGIRGDYEQGANYFCSDLKAQTIVDVGQLGGVWYVIEKIIHTEESHYIVNKTTCPVVYISEEFREPSTYNPLSYKSSFNTPYDPSDYSTSYHNRNPIDWQRTNGDNYYERTEYDPSTSYPHHRRKPILTRKALNDLWSMKKLRIYWDDVESTEYNLKYNISKPSFWISSGPENSDEIPRDIKHFAGTVQVLKAVGNHMALAFCHHLIKRELFTVILAREIPLDIRDIHSVHSIMSRLGLNVHAIERSCNSGSKMLNFDMSIIWVILGSYFLKIKLFN